MDAQCKKKKSVSKKYQIKKKISQFCLPILDKMITLNGLRCILLMFLSALLPAYSDIRTVLNGIALYVLLVSFTYYHVSNIYLQHHLFSKPERTVLFSDYTSVIHKENTAFLQLLLNKKCKLQNSMYGIVSFLLKNHHPRKRVCVEVCEDSHQPPFRTIHMWESGLRCFGFLVRCFYNNDTCM